MREQLPESGCPQVGQGTGGIDSPFIDPCQVASLRPDKETAMQAMNDRASDLGREYPIDARRFSLLELPVCDGFTEAVQRGLGQRPRQIPPRFFYDSRGSELFERICALPEYYVCRTEYGILKQHAAEIEPPEVVIELGCGYGLKTQLLFEAFFRRRAQMTCVPVDISRRALVETGRRLIRAYPGLSVRAIRADFETACPYLQRTPGLVLILGSNIGNLEREEAARFLAALRGHQILAGFDMQKDPDALHAAYNDPQGVTAAFNLNLLARINRELGGNFNPDRWRHLAFYDARAGRIEMHLVSAALQAVRVGAARHVFEAGERIHTENSHKFTMAQIRDLAAGSGMRIERWWMDARGWFSVVLLS